jgi:cell division ATPase FtsA
MIDKERSKAVPSNSAPLQIIEQKIFDVRLNGYSVTDWQDKNAKNLEVAFAVSIAGTSMVQYLLDECRPVASSGHIHFHSALLLKLIGVEKALNLGENFNLIYVHGEMTDLAVIERHSCIFFGSLPIGSITLGRMVAESAKCDRQAADSLISLYFSNQLDKSSGKDQSAAVKESIAKWGEGVSKLIADSKVPLASSNAIVLSAGHLNDFFGQAVATVYPKSKISFVPAEDFLPTAIHSLNLSE